MGEVGGGTGKNGGKAEKIGGEWGKVRHSPSPKYLRQQHSLLLHSMGPVVLFGGGRAHKSDSGSSPAPSPQIWGTDPQCDPQPQIRAKPSSQPSAERDSECGHHKMGGGTQI